jgi:NADH-quinone oxidoreductase subunit M
MNDLMTLFITPLIASLCTFFLFFLTKNAIKYTAFTFSLIPFLYLSAQNTALIGNEIDWNWFNPLNVKFHLKVDELSLLFLFLVTLVIPISIAIVKTEKFNQLNIFFGLILILEALLIVFFTARDLAVFTIFWEAVLIPLYFIITLFGGSERREAAIEFLVYMIAGSTLMIAALLFLYITAGSFDIDTLSKISDTNAYLGVAAAIFFLAFAVKTPLFPFHGWLPRTYSQAPLSGLILLAALLSKAGVYGFLRLGVELFPTFLRQWSPFLLTFAIIGVLYSALIAFAQKDFKKVIIYSSLSHVNFILVGIFAMQTVALQGSILQSINHGITITALFAVSFYLEERLFSTSFSKAGGLAQFLPILCWLTLFFVLASIALPGTNNFVGEILIFLGLFKSYGWITAILGLSVILSVMYMLRYMRKIYFGPPTFFEKCWVDISFYEIAALMPLIILILIIGIYPAPFLNLTKPFAEKIKSKEIQWTQV